MSMEMLAGIFVIGPAVAWFINTVLHVVVPVLIRHGWR